MKEYKDTKIYVQTNKDEFVIVAEIPHKGRVMGSSVGIKPNASGHEVVKALRTLANSLEYLMEHWEENDNNPPEETLYPEGHKGFIHLKG